MNSNQLLEKAKRGKRPFQLYYYSSSAPDLEMNRAEAQIWNRCIDEMAAIIQQPVSQSYKLPDGWKLVPIEPTEEMIAAGDQFMDGLSRLGDAYEAMVAAAPEPE